jgi:putative PIN family toxin of toxin-antitoxin system
VSLVAVFDTNILFSGLGWRGRPFECLDLARNGQVESVTCPEILAELEALLIEKQAMSPDEAKQAIAEVKAFSRQVDIPNQLVGVLTDADDHKVLECAVAGTATHIVTGDRRHLLPLGSYQDIPIVTAAQFLAVAAAQAGQPADG